MKKFTDKKAAKLKKVVELAVRNMVALAQRKVAVKHGRLRASLHPVMSVNKLSGRAVTNVEYAPYVEFGTIELVEVPNELTEYAMQFKGKGIRKKGGMKARPYLYPALVAERPKFIAAIKTIMNQKET
jgi:hypothetical protein